MNYPAYISPSIACCPLECLEEHVHRLEQLGIEMLHVDIMDGNFVANYCLGTEFIPLLHRITKLPLDIHLMIQRPDQKLSFIPFESGDYVTIHAESTPHIQKTLAEIRRRGAKAGLALNPATPLDYCRWMLPDIDLLLVMTINPGFAGQKLVPQTLDKIRCAKELLERAGSTVLIETDGNVSFIKNDIIVQHDFLRDVGNYTHQIINRIPDSDKIFFDTQRFALKDISASQYYSFSAPTSMGKTFVIINFIKNKLKENVSENFVIVVPTRALLSEIANKLINELKDYLGANCHKVITTMTAVQQDEKFIAVLTPERLYHSLLKQPEIEFKYLFIDEAHKISDKDKRSIIYYKILDMLKERPFVHIYFSSPVIPNPDIYLELTNFYNQDGNKVSGRSFRFSPVIQNKIYLDLNQKTAYVVNALSNQLVPCGNLLDGVSDKLGAVTRLGGKCNLIYVSSANKAVIYAMELCQRIGTCTNKIEPELNAIAKQIEQKIHKEYYLARMIRHGIAYHIGALPAEIRAKIESLLRKGLIKYCFCTSTLLEGVNVPADNLFVFDNKKGPSAMSTIDAFNLIGRAGRVTLNEMGNVYILIDDKRKQKYFDEVLLKPLPNQELLPQKALEKKHKKAIVSTLLQGKTNLIEAGEKYSDRGFTETSYEYATKCLNMLVHDICSTTAADLYYGLS